MSIPAGYETNTVLAFTATVKEVVAPAQVIKILESDFVERESCMLLSHEDRLFNQLLSSGVHRLPNGQIEMPLPFKHGQPSLPNNKELAERRLGKLANKLRGNPELKKQYVAHMDNLFVKGYAEPIPDDDGVDQTLCSWYIPHHGVFHPQKPNKLRVVFDCSFKLIGVSINDHLLQGPDLMNSLVGILLRFRIRKIAFSCDIEGMFYQFKVNSGDRDYLRFLWYPEGDLDSRPKEYRMTVHLFGATSSPGCATFGLRHLADLFSQNDTAVHNFIHRDFYVDDGLKSTHTPSEAVELLHQTRNVLEQGGIRLHKVVSNCRELLEAVPPEDRSSALSQLDLHNDILPSERTLGIEWCPQTDTFQFHLNLKDCPPTRRGILSNVCSIYDPLGLIAPVVLFGKRILQETHREGFGIDDNLPEPLLRQWINWKNALSSLSTLEIPRWCHLEAPGNVRSVELHHFSDASSVGYGQCSYLRIVDIHGEIHCTLVFAKSRVAPIKTVSIPRLELTAAVVSVRVSKFLGKELDCDHLQEYFWTDSLVFAVNRSNFTAIGVFYLLYSTRQ